MTNSTLHSSSLHERDVVEHKQQAGKKLTVAQNTPVSHEPVPASSPNPAPVLASSSESNPATSAFGLSRDGVTPQSNTTLSEIVQQLCMCDNFVITGHVNPDGDCLGAQLALMHALRSMGKTATCIRVSNTPLDSAFQFLPGINSIVPAEEFHGECGCFVAVDVPTLDRIGAGAQILQAAPVSITIDHHACDTTMTQYVYVNPRAAAASLLVGRVCLMLEQQGATLSSAAAQCAFTGLATDTGSFQYGNTDLDAFECACSLLHYGANVALTSSFMFQRRTLASYKLQARTIARARFYCENTCVISSLALDDFTQLHATLSDSEDLVNALRSIEGVEVAVMLRETPDGIRCSARSKLCANVRMLAQSFGGGGHIGAAGFTIHDASLDEACNRVAALLPTLYATLPEEIQRVCA